MSSRMPSRRGQQGFTIVEMMVAVIIGLFLLGGAITMFVTSRQTYSAQEDLSHIQESARFALEVMFRDIRMAGYFGCSDDMERINNNLKGNVDAGGTPGNLFDLSRAIEGLERTVGGPAPVGWVPSGNVSDHTVTSRGGNAIGDAIDGSDAITVRSLGGNNAPIIGLAAAGAAITIDNRDLGIQQNDVVGVSDCGATDVFQVTNATATPPSANQALEHATGGVGEATNNSASLSRDYSATSDSPAIVSPVVATRYYIGRTNAGPGPALPGLFRRVWVGGTGAGRNTFRNELLVEGVERMEITYGVDTNGDKLPDMYFDAGVGQLDEDTEWNNVVAVRIGLLLRSLGTSSRDVVSQPHIVNGQSIADPNDGYRRRAVNSTIFLRNDSQ